MSQKTVLKLGLWIDRKQNFKDSSAKHFSRLSAQNSNERSLSTSGPGVFPCVPEEEYGRSILDASPNFGCKRRDKQPRLNDNGRSKANSASENAYAQSKVARCPASLFARSTGQDGSGSRLLTARF